MNDFQVGLVLWFDVQNRQLEKSSCLIAFIICISHHTAAVSNSISREKYTKSLIHSIAVVMLFKVHYIDMISLTYWLLNMLLKRTNGTDVLLSILGLVCGGKLLHSLQLDNR